MDEQSRNQRMKLLDREIIYFQKLLEDLLFLSGLVSNASNRLKEEFNVSNIILDIAEVIENKGIDIDLSCPDELTCFGDPFLFRRMIRNVLDNAGKHAKKEIRIKARLDHMNLVIDVTDDGPGLTTQAMQDYGKKRTSRKIEYCRPLQEGQSDSPIDISLGLGSVIINNIVKRFDGQLKVKNRLIGGAHISITLPLPNHQSKKMASNY